MGRQRFNKKDWIEKANRLFQSRNRRTIMEQSAGPTVEMFACVDCQMQSIGQVPTSELDDIGGNGSYYSKYNLIWDGVNYQNMKIDELLEKGKHVITAVDKHYWEYLHLFPKGTILVIHDPTEVKGKNNELVKFIKHFKIIILFSFSVKIKYVTTKLD